MLRLEALAKRYRTGDHALKGVSLRRADKGQVMGLIGPSGAGKSTLIRCINRLVEPTGGEHLPRRHRPHPARRAADCAARAGGSA